MTYHTYHYTCTLLFYIPDSSFDHLSVIISLLYIQIHFYIQYIIISLLFHSNLLHISSLHIWVQFLSLSWYYLFISSFSIFHSNIIKINNMVISTHIHLSIQLYIINGLTRSYSDSIQQYKVVSSLLFIIHLFGIFAMLLSILPSQKAIYD